MLNINFVKEKILAGKSVVGIWSIINNPMLVEVAAHAGLDFQILDMEHGVIDFSILENCIRSCEIMQCSPLVRVPELNKAFIQNCLDLGAHGIIVPQINGYNEARQAIEATKFSPQGTRGFNPFTRASGYNPNLSLESTKLNNQFPISSIIIETKGALEELDKILTISELDMIYLGIYDLAFALGHGGNTNNPDILTIVDTSIKKIKEAGKIVSLMVKDESEIKKYFALGVQVMVSGVDTNIYLSAIKQKIEPITILKNQL